MLNNVWVCQIARFFQQQETGGFYRGAVENIMEHMNYNINFFYHKLIFHKLGRLSAIENVTFFINSTWHRDFIVIVKKYDLTHIYIKNKDELKWQL